MKKLFGIKIKSLNFIERKSKKSDESKALRNEYGLEYVANEFKNFLKQLSVALTSLQNGFSELIARILVDCGRSILNFANLEGKL